MEVWKHFKDDIYISNKGNIKGRQKNLLNTGKTYKSINEASKEFGFPKSTIRESIIQNFKIRHIWRFSWV